MEERKEKRGAEAEELPPGEEHFARARKCHELHAEDEASVEDEVADEAALQMKVTIGEDRDRSADHRRDESEAAIAHLSR